MHETRTEPVLDSCPAAPRRRRRRVIAAALLGVAVLVPAGWLLLRPAPPEPPAVDLTDADPEVKQAIDEARQAVHKAPRSAAAWGKLGMVLVAHDFRGEAAVALAEAERLDPNEPRWPYLQGTALLRDYPERALPPLRRAAALSREPAVRLRLAEVLLDRGQVDEAEDLFRQVGRADADNARVEFGLARVARARGDPAGCLKRLQQAADLPRTRPRAVHALLAELYRQFPGKGAEAEREQETVARLPEDPPWPDPYAQDAMSLRVGKQVRLEKAGALRRAGQVRDAETLMQETVRLYPKSDLAWLELGAVRVQANKFAGAEQAYERATKLGPTRFEAHFRLGVAIYFQRAHRPGALTDAARAFREAIRLAPTVYPAYFRLGMCLEDLHDRAGAVRAYQATLRCRPDHPEGHRNLGRLLTEATEEATVAACCQRLCACLAALDVTAVLHAQAADHLRHADRLAPHDVLTRKAIARLHAEYPGR